MAVENLTLTSRGNNAIPSGHGEANKVTTMIYTVEVTAAASATSTYSAPFGIPHDARMLGGVVYWDDLASSGSPTLDFGLKSGTKSVTADADAFIADLDAATVNQVGRGGVAIENIGKRAWELVSGATANPPGTLIPYFSILDADTNTGGTVTWEVTFIQD